METSKIEQLEKQLAEHKIKLAAFESELQKAKEVQKEKGYAWEECFSGVGFCVTSRSNISRHNDLSGDKDNANVAATEKVCKSHLAACQLSHIIEAINKDFDGKFNLAFGYDTEGGDNLLISPHYGWALPTLKSYEGAECLQKNHTPLLKQYFGAE